MPANKIPVSVRFTEVPYCPVCYQELDPGDALRKIPEEQDQVVLSCPKCKCEFSLEAHVDIRFSTISRVVSLLEKGDGGDAVKTVSDTPGGTGGK